MEASFIHDSPVRVSIHQENTNLYYNFATNRFEDQLPPPDWPGFTSFLKLLEEQPHPYLGQRTLLIDSLKWTPGKYVVVYHDVNNEHRVIGREIRVV